MAENHENFWTINHFSTVENKEGFSMASPFFEIGVQGKLKSQWRAVLYPRGSTKENAGQVSLLLELERSNFSRVEAEFEFWFSGMSGKKTYPSSTITKEFSVSQIDFRMWGFLALASYEQLQTITVHDQLKIFCDIKILSFGGTVLDVVFPVNSSCDQLWTLYNDQKLVDLTIKVEGEEYGVHRVILASKSSVFAAMFEHDMVEKTNSVVTITDYKPEVIERFVDFVYKGRCDGFKDHAAELLSLAEKYDVTTLKAECEVLLARLLTVETAAHTLSLAHTHNATFLKDEALYFIKNNVKAVMDKDGWEDVIGTPALIDTILHMMAGVQIRQKPSPSQ